jgi:hypothetical protein
MIANGLPKLVAIGHLVEPQPSRGRHSSDNQQCLWSYTESRSREARQRRLESPAGAEPVSDAVQSHGAKLHGVGSLEGQHRLVLG